MTCSQTAQTCGEPPFSAHEHRAGSLQIPHLSLHFDGVPLHKCPTLKRGDPPLATTLPWLSLLALFWLELTSCFRSAAKTEDAVPVRVARAIVEDVPLEVVAAGNVQSIHTVDVKSRLAG